MTCFARFRLFWSLRFCYHLVYVGSEILSDFVFVTFYNPMHLFSVSTAIPVFALAVVLVNSNLSLALSDFSARIVAFAYTGWDISLSGTAASWSFFSLLLFCSLVILFAFSTYLDFDDSHFEFQIKLLAFFCSMVFTSRWNWISVTSDLRSGWMDFVSPYFALVEQSSNVQAGLVGTERPSGRRCGAPRMIGDGHLHLIDFYFCILIFCLLHAYVLNRLLR